MRTLGRGLEGGFGLDLKEGRLQRQVQKAGDAYFLTVLFFFNKIKTKNLPYKYIF